MRRSDRPNRSESADISSRVVSDPIPSVADSLEIGMTHTEYEFITDELRWSNPYMKMVVSVWREFITPNVSIHSTP